MMTRTQIYLPAELHANLLRIAREEDTTLSRLVREGSETVVKKRYGNMTPTQSALKFLSEYPDRKRLKLTASAVDLVRQERD